MSESLNSDHLGLLRILKATDWFPDGQVFRRMEKSLPAVTRYMETTIDEGQFRQLLWSVFHELSDLGRSLDTSNFSSSEIDEFERVLDAVKTVEQLYSRVLVQQRQGSEDRMGMIFSKSLVFRDYSFWEQQATRHWHRTDVDGPELPPAEELERDQNAYLMHMDHIRETMARARLGLEFSVDRSKDSKRAAGQTSVQQQFIRVVAYCWNISFDGANWIEDRHKYKLAAGRPKPLRSFKQFCFELALAIRFADQNTKQESFFKKIDRALSPD